MCIRDSIISEHPPYPRMADMETLPQISPQAALNLVRNMAEGLLTLHRLSLIHICHASAILFPGSCMSRL